MRRWLTCYETHPSAPTLANAMIEPIELAAAALVFFCVFIALLAFLPGARSTRRLYQD
jgi:hypothetical protein